MVLTNDTCCSQTVYTNKRHLAHEQRAQQGFLSHVRLLSTAALAYHSAIRWVLPLKPPVADLLKERKRNERELRHHDTLEADNSRAARLQAGDGASVR